MIPFTFRKPDVAVEECPGLFNDFRILVIWLKRPSGKPADIVKSGTSYSSETLFWLPFLRRYIVSASGFILPVCWTMSNWDVDIVGFQSAKVQVAFATLRIHWSRSWLVCIVRLTSCKKECKSAYILYNYQVLPRCSGQLCYFHISGWEG